MKCTGWSLFVMMYLNFAKLAADFVLAQHLLSGQMIK